MVFSKTLINWAWGYHHEGWIIDSSGSLRSFNYDIPDSMWLAFTDSFISQEEMEKILSLSSLTERKVPMDTLTGMGRLIEPASKGALSDPADRCRDAGGLVYEAYMLDSLKGGFRIILLYEAGDWAMKNISTEAQILYTWLMAIDNMDAEGMPCSP
jgi:hypothetical protein